MLPSVIGGPGGCLGSFDDFVGAGENDGGMIAKPSAVAVLRLIDNSNLSADNRTESHPALPLENLANLVGRAAEEVHGVRSVGHEPAKFHKATVWIRRRQPRLLASSLITLISR